jgi:hypothetical protein
MDSSAQPLDSLHAFRNSLYRCFQRRADALFELTDALLSAGTVPSPPHLIAWQSRPPARLGQPLCRAQYGTHGRGRCAQIALCTHPIRHPDPDDPSIYAVDVSVRPCCDAEASPERGYYYHP